MNALFLQGLFVDEGILAGWGLFKDVSKQNSIRKRTLERSKHHNHLYGGNNG